MNEYEAEIKETKQTLERLRLDEAPKEIQEEHAAQLANLSAIYAAAQEVHVAGETELRLRAALEHFGYGEWSLDNVYAYVYETTMEAADLVDGGGDVAAIADDTDFVASLLESLDEQS